jgi:hypothetical protein
MTSAALSGLLLRQPFQPFTFVLRDNTIVQSSGHLRTLGVLERCFEAAHDL